MDIQKLLSAQTLLSSLWLRRVLPLVVVVAITLTQYCIFMVVPNEQVMGAVQRIFYFHVGAAMAAYAMIAVLFIASIMYLSKRVVQWDRLAEAAGSVAFVFCSVVLASGMIWGHSAWNTWWRWEPRLVSFLVLWLLLLSYLLLRMLLTEHPRQRNFAAVLGILAAVNVPLVIFSIKLLDQSQQLHPEVVAKRGLRDASFVYTLILANVSVILLSFWLMLSKLQTLLLMDEKQSLQRRLRS